jgi:hypothetical protein
VPPARLAGGEPSAQRDLDATRPIRRSLFGGGVGAIGPSTRTSKKGLRPCDYMSPFSAIDKIDGPATIM